MKPYLFHTRVFIFNYTNTNLPKFKTREQERAWHEALGRLLAYNLRRGAQDDSTDLVVARLSSNPTEVLTAYYMPLHVPRDENGFSIYEGSAEQAVAALHDRLATPDSFVLCAHHSNNSWSFNS